MALETFFVPSTCWLRRASRGRNISNKQQWTPMSEDGPSENQEITTKIFQQFCNAIAHTNVLYSARRVKRKIYSDHTLLRDILLFSTDMAVKLSAPIATPKPPVPMVLGCFIKKILGNGAFNTLHTYPFLSCPVKLFHYGSRPKSFPSLKLEIPIFLGAFTVRFSYSVWE